MKIEIALQPQNVGSLISQVDFMFQIHWKLALILCVVDAYISWSNKSQYFAPELSNQHFTKEKMFYLCFGLAAAGEFPLSA